MSGYQVLWHRPGHGWQKSAVFDSEQLANASTFCRPAGVPWQVQQVEDEPQYDHPAVSRWFGEAWPYPYAPAPICEDYRLHIATPDHEDCMGCDEPILPSESGTRMPFFDGHTSRWVYQHAECGLRAVMCPIDMGLVEDPTGKHEHIFANRRAEGKQLLEWSRSRQVV